MHCNLIEFALNSQEGGSLGARWELRPSPYVVLCVMRDWSRVCIEFAGGRESGSPWELRPSPYVVLSVMRDWSRPAGGGEEEEEDGFDIEF